MKKTALAAGAASILLVSSAGTAALAAAHQPAAKHTLKVKLSNYKPKAGDNITATMAHANKKVGYVCLLTTYKKGVALSANDSFTSTASLNHKPNSKGVVTCSETFIPGTTPHGHSCPPTKKDKKSGWKCGIAVADPAAQGNAHEGKNYAVGLFKF